MPVAKIPDFSQLFTLAARVNNAKRSYLLVNPYQAKHIPARPAHTIGLCQALARAIPPEYHSPETLVIGFAETATAVGALLADALHPACRYIHTTREPAAAGHRVLCFSEVHSHAAEQLLRADKLQALLYGVTHLVLVDDELTTGNTICNLLDCLMPFLPRNCACVAASLINRMNPADRKRFSDRGVAISAVQYSPDTDASEAQYTAATTGLSLIPPTKISGETTSPGWEQLPLEYAPRDGIFSVLDYRRACETLASRVTTLLPDAPAGRWLLLGTEECMAPAIWLGHALEAQFPGLCVFCHATTRSPIGILDRDDYSIRSGVTLPSCYDPERVTFLYNLTRYDGAVFLSDGRSNPGKNALVTALRRTGTAQIFGVSL